MNRTIRVWDVPSGREVCQLTGHTSWVGSLAFSPDGTRIASASDDATVRLWDAESGREVLTLHGHGASVNSVAFSRDGRWLASASNNGTIRLWDGNPWHEPNSRTNRPATTNANPRCTLPEIDGSRQGSWQTVIGPGTLRGQ